MEHKRKYSKPQFTLEVFVSERVMAGEQLISAQSYGEIPKNVKYTLGQLQNM